MIRFKEYQRSVIAELTGIGRTSAFLSIAKESPRLGARWHMRAVARLADGVGQKVSQHSKGAEQNDESKPAEFAKQKLADLNIALAFCLPLTEQFTNCASKACFGTLRGDSSTLPLFLTF